MHTDETPEKNIKEEKDVIKKSEKPGKPSFTDDFKRRIKAVKPTRWVRFTIVSILFFLLVIWIGSPWLAILWLLLVDIYITAYIPWTWWRNKTGPLRTAMGWLDAII